MDIDRVFSVFQATEVDCLLIGGLNYFLRHRPVTTQDIDLFIAADAANLSRCEAALDALDASWGKTDEDWGPVRGKPRGWLQGQGVFCLLTPAAALDIFLEVPGLDSFSACYARSVTATTLRGASIRAICDADLLACQLALPEPLRRRDRAAHLQSLLEDNRTDDT